MKIRYVGRLTVALLAFGLTSGCEVLRVHKTVDRVDAQAEEASDLVASMRDPKKLGRQPSAFQDEPLVNLKPLQVKPGIPTNSDCKITYTQEGDIMALARAITKSCGLPVRVTSDVMDGGASQSQGQSGGTGPAPMSANDMSGLFPGGSANRSAIGGSGSSYRGRDTQLRNLNYTGDLSGLLDVATSQLGLSWKYNPHDRSITVFYLDTRTYNFYVFASSTDMQSTVQSGTTASAGTGGSGSGAGSGGTSGISGYSGSSQATTLSLKTSITDDIEQNVKTMLSNVGRMSFSRSTGMITVTDRPDVLDQVGSYVAAENANLSKQVLLNIKVYSVTLNDQDSAGIDWNLVYKAANWNFNLKNTFQDAATNSVSGAVGILDGSFAGSNAVIKALSQQGRVSVITSPSVTTLNLQPVPVQVARQTGYLASIQTTNTAQVGSSTSLTPGTVTSGFNMSLLPFVESDNQMRLQFFMNISTLIRLRAESSGDNRIQVPEIDNRIFNQTVRLKSGETLVLSGFDQTSEQGTKAGVGESWNFLLGGGVNRTTVRDVIVVMITPIVKG